MEIHVLFKFANNPYGGIEIDTTSGSGNYRELSPFVLGPIDTYLPGIQSKNFENLWQFSKVYKEHVDEFGFPNDDWYKWREKGWNNPKAIRYPMGKGIKPLFSHWNGENLDYITARKRIYAPIYAKYVTKTDSFKRLEELCHNSGQRIILRDYDAYNHLSLGMTLVNVINNPNRKCGHAFVLMMILTGVLEECLK